MDIEERAQMCVDKIGILGAYQGYIIGATEQKKIDIDKACDWMERWFIDSRYYTPQEVLDSLRKAMEE